MLQTPPPASPPVQRLQHYGTLFPELEPWEPPGADEAARRVSLLQQAEALRRPAQQADVSSPKRLPAGYTYFGQLVAHDLSFLLGPDPAARARPEELRNARSPRFDLDSLYGGGPLHCRHLYARKRPWEFLLGGRADRFRGTGLDFVQSSRELDLPRNAQGTALIADSRNDQHVIISQMHLALLRAHNRLAREGDQAAGAPPEERLDAARAILTRHFQWILFHEYLPAVLDAERGELVRDAIEKRQLEEGRHLRFLALDAPFELPLELVAAALRFGHSMVRSAYRLNATTAQPVRLTPDSWAESGFHHLSGFSDLRNGWTIDWRFFLRADPTRHRHLYADGEAVSPQLAHAIGPFVSSRAMQVPPQLGGARGARTLAEVSLLRGWALGLPSGPALARELGVEPLEGLEGLPLWPYVLHEAARVGRGRNLGPVGSILLAESFLRVLFRDPEAFVHAPHWRPTMGRGADFELIDLLTYADAG